MPRAKTPTDLESLASTSKVGATIIRQMNQAGNLQTAIDSMEFSPEDGLMLLPPKEAAPPEVRDLWAFTCTIRQVDRQLKDADDHKEAADLLKIRIACLKNIADIHSRVRQLLSKAADNAFSAMVAAEKLDLSKIRAGVKAIAIDDGDAIDVEAIEAAYSEAELEAMVDDGGE
jgi:hypothetical protein